MKPGVDYTGVCINALCHDGHGRILLQKRSSTSRGFHGMWEEGGGGLEFEENPRDAILREIQEEYGCHGIIQKELEAFSFIFDEDGKRFHWIGIPFIILVDPGEVQSGVDSSVAEVGWFTWDTLPEPITPGFEMLLEKYKEALAQLSA